MTIRAAGTGHHNTSKRSKAKSKTILRLPDLSSRRLPCFTRSGLPARKNPTVMPLTGFGSPKPTSGKLADWYPEVGIAEAICANAHATTDYWRMTSYSGIACKVRSFTHTRRPAKRCFNQDKQKLLGGMVGEGKVRSIQ